MFKNIRILILLMIITSILSGCYYSIPKNVPNSENDIESSQDVQDKELPDTNTINPKDVIISKRLEYNVENFYAKEEDIETAMKYIGNTYPNLTLKDKEDIETILYDIDEPIILEYSSPYCNACLGILNYKKEFTKKYPEYELITLIDEDTVNAFELYDFYNYTHNVFTLANFDTISREDIGVEGYPFYIFIDTDKTIKLVHLGTVDVEMLEGLSYIAFEADKNYPEKEIIIE